MWGVMAASRALAMVCLALLAQGVQASEPRLANARVVFTTRFGDVHMAMFPDVRS